MSAQALPTPLPPLPTETSRQLQQLLPGLDAGSLWWVSGYAAGLAQARGAVARAPLDSAEAEGVAARATEATAAQPQGRLTIVYGSQTGNARRIAESLAAEAEAAGLRVRLLRADAYPLRELKDETLLYVVVSTQGEGEPPEDSQALFEFLDGRRAPPLPQLRYAVLGLGDSSYALFNAAARHLDARLAALGATPLLPRAEADVDVTAVAPDWAAQALAAAGEALRGNETTVHLQSASVTPLRRAVAAPIGRDAPVAAGVLLNQRLSGRDSAKDVRHIELDLAGSGLAYEPGDALGLWHENPPALVEEVLAVTGLDGTSEVAEGGHVSSLHDWLLARRELTRPSRSLLATLAEQCEDDLLQAVLAEPPTLAAWLSSHQVIDALARWRAAWSADRLVAALRPLTPRLYSIASSRAAVGDEAHLTVDVLRYAQQGRIRVGAASSHLARQAEGASLRVYVEPNERFRLPADGSRDLIMIGPGTGVAPFRGFLQQRIAEGARGRHWLLFGAQHKRHDFLYQTEWLQARRAGQLQRLDVAFSRDQPQKIYVQDRLREHGREVFDWLESGAHLYVCGSIAMGRDVQTALVEVVATHGGRDHEVAAYYLRTMQQQSRYSTDVY
jgi:sulfite reductase (NADPH) flavoprotein alpha-component